MDPIRVVRALRAKAESTTFEPEAIACRRKAEQLMDKYRLTEPNVQPLPPDEREPMPWGMGNSVLIVQIGGQWVVVDTMTRDINTINMNESWFVPSQR
jgi:hypothetical protein